MSARSLSAVALTCVAALLPAAPAEALRLDPLPTGFASLTAGGAFDAFAALRDPADPLPTLIRLAPADYVDGVGALIGEPDRPAARAISNAVSTPERRRPAPGFSDLLVAYVQFFASHEIAQTPTLPGPENAIDVPVAPDDPVAVQIGGAPVMVQQRSAIAKGTGASTPREQINGVTPAFDASTIYGSDADVQAMLRLGDGSGRMVMGPDDGLPLVDGRPRSGDARADENPTLQSLHTVFAREHNRLAELIGAACDAAGESCSGDQIFAAARKLVSLQQQKIFFEEAMPHIVGVGSLAGLAKLVPDASLLDLPAGVINEATTAALRIGHTMVPDVVVAALPGGPRRETPLEACFFGACPTDMDAVLYGSSIVPGEAVDPFVVEPLRNGLVPGFGETVLIDLLATNIQRGRDHGLGSYSAVREALGFAETDAEALLPEWLLDVYRDDFGVLTSAGVDLLPALFAEDPIDGAAVGETTAALWALQFSLLAKQPGFYLEDGLDPDIAGWLTGIDMAGLIARNTPFTRAQIGDPFASVPVPAALPIALLGLGALWGAGRRRPV